MAAQAPSYPDLAIHTLGWKAFQDLCADISEVILQRPVEIFREARDGGQDAIFFAKSKDGDHLATVQCKFTSKSDARLQLGDLSEEFKSVETLVESKQAQTYVLITNRVIDAPDALKIRERLFKLGVSRPHIFGRHAITRAIRSSARLRALVPRVYGLGDLSTILDERSAAQTEALLGHLKPLLSVYVTTGPHAEAVRSLSKHSAVLLLGDPGTGKSTIAAILSTIAASNPDRLCIRADGINDFISRWNPIKPGFFWIDDAFGPNQLREDFVDAWLTHFPKMLAAIGLGSQFVLTSRHHIYKGAEIKLGSRNIALFREEQAVVKVGALTRNERLQLIYNHMKVGMQTWTWKSRIKGFLPVLAEEKALTPEIARRLADPAYTKQLDLTLVSLLQFVREPKAHLLQIIREMSKEHRSALTLAFLHHGKMPVGNASTELQTLITGSFGVSREALGQALQELRGSFLEQQIFEGSMVWTFKHPTVADAISAFLGETDGLTELYLRGTKSWTILVEVVCSGSAAIQDAIVVPEALNGLLIRTLGSIPDEPNWNSRLFDFLADRVSDNFFKEFVLRYPDALARHPAYHRETAYDSKINVLARAHRFGLLTEGVRAEASANLLASLSDWDASFLDNDDILALIPPTELMQTLVNLRDNVSSKLEKAISGITSEIDGDTSAEDHFYELKKNLEMIQKAVFGTSDEDVDENVKLMNSAISDGINEIEEALAQIKEDEEKDEWETREWESRQSRRSPPSPPSAPSTQSGGRGDRSIFSDVEE
jgi:energy-coupling factor transporter ATP-binding protein EcfA2